jgi:hypothetical protein
MFHKKTGKIGVTARIDAMPGRQKQDSRILARVELRKEGCNEGVGIDRTGLEFCVEATTRCALLFEVV